MLRKSYRIWYYQLHESSDVCKYWCLKELVNFQNLGERKSVVKRKLVVASKTNNEEQKRKIRSIHFISICFRWLECLSNLAHTFWTFLTIYYIDNMNSKSPRNSSYKCRSLFNSRFSKLFCELKDENEFTTFFIF